MLETLAHPHPELIWGILSRGIGLTLFLSFVSIAPQVLALAGRRGITPIADGLAASERDFAAPQRYFYFPTLLWLCRSDGFLRGLPVAGALCAASIVVGGPHTPWAFAACYLIYLSLDRAVTLIYPWDCLLFEATLFAVFLPATCWPPSLALVEAPAPALAWVFRLMVFRVMLGFGKHKFLGTTAQDKGFLKGFFVNQPLPSPIGLWAHHLPIGFHRLALLLMFLVEVPVPFLVFWPGPLSSLAGLSVVGLMVGIQLTGNFGYFNLAMVVLALSWFDTETAVALSQTDLWATPAGTAQNAVFIAHMALSVVCFVFNSFCAHSWMLWSLFQRARSPLVRWPATIMRWVHPFRFVHAYGVFPPQSPSPVKLSPVTEVSWDGTHFEPLRYRLYPTTEDSPAVFCAPHHERVDQAVVYESVGLNESMVYRNIAGRFDPYGHGGTTAPERMLDLLLNGAVPSHSFYDRRIERGRGRPRYARVRLYALTPTTPAERKATGATWHKELVGPHLPLRSRGQERVRDGNPPPELWHFEDFVWLLRSRFGQVMRRVQRSPEVSAHEVVLAEAEHLDERDVAWLWTELIPSIPPTLRQNWTGLRSEVDRLSEETDAHALYRAERLAHRYGALLFAKLYPGYCQRGLLPALGFGKAPIAVPSLYHLRLLCLDVVAQGKQAFDAAWSDPTLVEAQAAGFTMFAGQLLPTLFRYETVVYQSQKLRLLKAIGQHDGRPVPTAKQRQDKQKLMRLGIRLWGNLETGEFLREQLQGPEHQLDVPERWPRFTIEPDGSVVRKRSP